MNIISIFSLISASAIAVASLAYSFFQYKHQHNSHIELQIFQIENLPEYDREKIKKFKDVFEYWGNVLQYDEQISDERWAYRNVLPVFEEVSKVNLSGEAHMCYFKECLNKFIANSVAKSKKGICRDFAPLLLMEGQKIGFDTYLISTTTHVANLYKLQGKWYVADLTDQVTGPEDRDFNYKIPVERFIKCATARKVQRMNIKVEFGGKNIPVDEFMQNH